MNVHCQVDFDLGVGLDSHMEGCAINDTQLLLCWETQVQLLQFKTKNPNKAPITNGSLPPVKDPRLKSARQSNHPSLCSAVCLTRLPVCANGDTITKIANNKVMFVGSYWIFEGELTENKIDIIWKKMEFPRCIPRQNRTIYEIRPKSRKRKYPIFGYRSLCESNRVRK